MKRFKNILYVADSSGIVLQAFHHAVGLAERNKARLTVILVMERIPAYLTRLTSPTLREAQVKELQATVERLAAWAAGRVEIESRIIEGTPFLEVIRAVLRNRHDLVIKSVGSDAGAVDWLFGSLDMNLLRKCPCPVWLIKANGPLPIRRVMACVDFSDLDHAGADTAEPLNRMVLEMAGSLAFVEQSEFHVVHAWDAIGEALMRGTRAGADEEEVDRYINEVRLEHRHWLCQLLHKAREWIGLETYDAVDPKTHVPKGRASDIIPRLAHELRIDVLVMGTVARTGIPGLIIGNTAENVLYRINCSVLAIKPPGFVTPVTLDD
ncbi:universal stress protein [Pelagibius litoralis]|uniref:Universal stress protein n=1 Tax=Pelagibius litoralis TaxID=374515 RepID=A0A967EUR5_9PROT|nr:universal stress protein [Pelagibius litoralis]NIA67412.1 universal stress protein [Pelagibius litoralis]